MIKQYCECCSHEEDLEVTNEYSPCECRQCGNTLFIKQIKNAEHSLSNWPEWMKISGCFAGSNTKHTPINDKSTIVTELRDELITRQRECADADQQLARNDIDIKLLRDEVEKYKDCLKFYATSSNYSIYATEPDYPHTDYTCLVMLDKGKMAKKALEAK